MKISAVGLAFSYGETYLDYSRQYSAYKYKNQDHCKHFIAEESLASIVQLFLQGSCDSIPTDRVISIQDDTFGAGFFRTWLQRGLPAFTEVRKYGRLKHMVSAYRSRFGKRTMQTNLHFLNGKLLYIHLCFSNADEAFRMAICKTLEEKYHCALPDQSAFTIEDNSGNRIKGICGMELNLYYLSGNKEQLRLLHDEFCRQAFIREKVSAKKMDALRRLI